MSRGKLITQAALESYLWGAATLLRGYIDAGDYKQFIFPLLFYKRRAYQHKVAFAEFEGICSGDILTFETKDPDVLIPELLPFIVQSDRFFNYALDTSAGSLSPRTSWTALQNYEFPLPPKPEQQRIAEILWAAEEAVESHLEVSDRLQESLLVARAEFFNNRSSAVAGVPLGQVGHWLSGGTPSRARPEYWKGDHLWVSPKDMKVNIITNSGDKLSEEAYSKSTKLPANGILIVVRGLILAHTFPVAIAGVELTFNQDMRGLVVSDAFLPLFVFHWLNYQAPRILRLVADSTHGTKRIPSDSLFRLEVPHLAKEEQHIAVKALEALRLEIAENQDYLLHLRSLKQALSNKLFLGDHYV
jgi:type I restriction enzyme S subunit